MEEARLYNNLLRALREKIPHKATLTRKLVDKLSIEREAVYRRLRGEVPFTLREMSILSREFGLSVDSIIKGEPAYSRQFKLYIDDDDDPMDTDFTKLNVVIEFLESVKTSHHSEFCNSSNTLPQIIFYKYRTISKFCLYKWIYQNDSGDTIRTFAETESSQRIQNLQHKYAAAMANIKNTTCIWDNMIFQYLINDIRYFRSIRLISDEDVVQLHSELMTLVDDLEVIATRGEWENGNRINFYISNINFDSGYSYLEVGEQQAAVIKVFALNRLTSVDPETFQRLKKWMQSLKRFSTLISESGEIQRVQFFDRQRAIIDTLRTADTSVNPIRD